MSDSSSSDESDLSSKTDFDEKKKFLADASNHEFFVNGEKTEKIQKNSEDQRASKNSLRREDDKTSLDSYQKHLGKQLSEMLDRRIKYLEKDLNFDEEKSFYSSSNADHVRLLGDSKVFVREESPVLSVKQKRPKIKKRKVDIDSEESSSDEIRSKRLKSVAVSGYSLLKEAK